jgi:putative membrane-bound dehydrogenase-like protein
MRSPFWFANLIVASTFGWMSLWDTCVAIESLESGLAFRAGAATVDITPVSDRSIVAGGFLEAQSSTIHDRLFVRSIVLDDGTSTICLTVVDTCMMPQSLIDEAKLLASNQCGIPSSNIMVSATHTHSAPAAMACLGTRLDKAYAEGLPAKIAESIVSAHAKREPARIGWNSVNDWEHTHNRRWIRKPEKKIVDPFGDATGLAHMHPGYQSSDVIGPSGPVDPELFLISVQATDGRPLAVFANYSQHYFGAQAISSDYYGLFCKYIAESLGESGDGNGPFVCAISQGTSGDLMWMDYGVPAKSMSMAAYAESVARYAEQSRQAIAYRDFARLGMVERTMALNYRVPDSKRLDWARPIAERVENDLAKNLQEVYAKEALILHERQSTQLKLQAIQIGDVTIATLPNEVYALTGLKLKGRSPSPWHFNIELANGAEGYLPPPEQHALGGYTTWPARTAGLESEAEPKIVESLLQSLEEVTRRSRRSMDDTHGPYARGILDAKPVSYWRLDDADGSSARNAIAGGQPARLSPGYAWYLPGVGSGTGIGAGEELSTSAFSGIDQINRGLHLAGGELTCELPQSSESYSISFWFWLGERSGASERQGTLCVGPSGESLVAKQFGDHTVQLELEGVFQSERLAADQWHMATLVREKGIVSLWVDGGAEPFLKSTATLSGESRQLRFGQGMQGKIDEIAYFARPLSTEEIQSFWHVSAVGNQGQVDIAKRKRFEERGLTGTSTIAFPASYVNAIAALNPIAFETFSAAATGMDTSGSVYYETGAFASFQSGRIATTYEAIGDAYSVSLWFRNQVPNAQRPVTAYLFSRGPDKDPLAPGDHLGIGGTYDPTMTGKLFWFNGNERNQVAIGRTNIAPNTWNHVIAIREKNHVKLLLNGETVPDLDTHLEVTTQGSKQFFLGARTDQFAPLPGPLAYYAIFDRALTTDEAQQLHSTSGQSAGTPVSGPEGTGKQPLPLPHSEPLSSERSLSKIHVPEGFRVELVACEPQVIDPVAFDWDAKGRLWVIEMSDYPMGMDGHGKAGGRVRILEDRDGDGRYESSSLFAEGLNFPNGLLTWRDGVLVAAAPQILFLRDTNGDGKADTNEVLFEGFNQGNQQLRMNGLRWGLDNWVYCANGGHHPNHGLETEVKSNRNGLSYAIGSRDFRIQPDSGELVIESGPSQFGRNRDAWGHWFGTQNAKPLWNYVLADRYLARNPYVPSASAIQFVLPPNSPQVYPASRPEKRFHSFQEAGHFTSACGGMIFGDSRLFGPSEQMHAFTCEPFHNLVQHNVLTDSGVSFTAERPTGEGRFDFFASEDRWCRPVMARTGPDGALWVADMYRYMIEHPDWLPPEGKEELLPHYRLGDDRGRIYRVVPIERPSTASPWELLSGDTAAIVKGLESRNDWQRDKAQQMLLWSNDASAIPMLEQLATSSASPQTRVQAYATLEGMRRLSNAMMIQSLGDRHARVRENAVRIAEASTEVAVQSAARRLVNDPDEKVCLQLAFTLGQWPGQVNGEALVSLARRFHREPMIRSAIMSSALEHASTFANGIAQSELQVVEAFREPIVRQSVGLKDAQVLNVLLTDALSSVGKDQMHKLDELLWTLQRVGVSFEDFLPYDADRKLLASLKQLETTLQQMSADAEKEEWGWGDRIAAAKPLCRTKKHREQGLLILSQGLKPSVALEFQQQILGIFLQSGHDDTVRVLASAWPELSPTLRTQAIETWMSRANWTHDLLDQMERGVIHASGFEFGQRDRLLHYPDPTIAERAAKLFQSRNTAKRQDVVATYRQAFELGGDVARGRVVFERACASCHRKDELGHEVGPNMATVVAHTNEKLLVNILDPNSDIQPGFQAYNVLLESGEVWTGLLVGETANSVSIKSANGITQTVSRLEIEQLRNSNLSLMPEGLESILTVQDLADVITFIR